jgi:hypothetical protein
MELKSNAPEIKWIIANAATNDFAFSLDRQLLSKGYLSDAQVAAVARKLVPVPGAVAVAGAGVQAVQTAFATASANGLKRPKLRLGGYVLSLAPATGRNAGAIYVKSTSEEYLGKITDGQFQPTRECTDEQRAEIVKLCANPVESAVAYGKQTGICACCGRELSDPESIERGIGPICAGKFGF